jgi:hypothetical protein
VTNRRMTSSKSIPSSEIGFSRLFGSAGDFCFVRFRFLLLRLVAIRVFLFRSDPNNAHKEHYPADDEVYPGNSLTGTVALHHGPPYIAPAPSRHDDADH